MQISAANWEQIAYLLAVSRAGSLRGAAEIMGTSHLKVNRQIHSLEASFGTDLVRRGRGGVTLTEAGERLLPAAEEAEQSFLQARRSLQGLDKQERGDLRFSLSGPMASDLMAPLLAKFSDLYPGINLIIHVSTEFEDPRLIKTDVSLRFVYEAEDDVVVRRLFPLALGCYAHRDYVRDELPKAGPLGEGLTWIGPPRSQGLDWLRHTAFPNAAVRHNLLDPLLHRELVKAGLGMTRLASFMTVNHPELIQVPGTEFADGPPLSIIIHPELRKTVRVRRFVDFLVKELTARRALLQGAAD